MRRSAALLSWLMIPVAGAFVLLLLLTLFGWRRPDADLAGGGEPGVAVGAHPAAEQMRQFFSWPSAVSWRPFTNAGNPFFTLAIQPAPLAKAPTPEPATRKVDVTYRGFFETSAKVKRAVVQVADVQILAGRGERVVADFVAVEIELRHLGLTNGAGQAVKLEFSKTQPIEIPAK